MNVYGSADLSSPLKCLSSESFRLPTTAVTSAWIEHTPFAMWLVESLKPKCLVELGTLHGVSYFTFCETVARLGAGTRCFAVDTWKGDEHTGFYDEDVWHHVSTINASHYSAFSTLIRETFDDALSRFDDGTIDLLHIDGRHFYDDVKHDFETSLPKLSDVGVVILHDTNVHERGFGVAKLFRELQKKYSTFEFLHGNGLGVVAVGSRPPQPMAPLLQASLDPHMAGLVRGAYARLGAGISDRLSLRHEESIVARLRSDIAFVQQAASSAAETAARLQTELATATGNAARARAEADATTVALHAELAAVRHEAQTAVRTASAEAEAVRAEAAASILATRSELMKARDISETAFRAASAETEAMRVKAEADVGAARAAAEAAKGEALAARAERDAQALELGRIESHRNQLLASTSWRMTAPLRLVSRLARPRQILSFARRLRRDGLSQALSKVRGLVAAKRAANALAGSGLFDRDWYLTTNPDVAVSGIDPLWHFVRRGTAERRMPSPLFDTGWYLATYPDVAASGINPLLHYLRKGAAEGRDPSPQFDSDWYLDRYPDVSKSGMNPLAHYQRSGAAEGRLPSKQVDPDDSSRSDGETASLTTVAPEHGVAPDASTRAVPAITAISRRFAYEPLISVIVPVFNIDPRWLRRAVASVRAQTYKNWELCVCDDGSTAENTIQALGELEATERNMRLARHPRNLGISQATNKALSLAKGEFVAFLDNDDELAEIALETYVAELNRDPEQDVLYSDEDKLDYYGNREEPFFKPDWSPAFLREVMYVGHLLMVRRSLIEKIGGLDPTYDGVQDFELMLRLSEHTQRVHHVRDILYHWRRIPGSVADHMDAKPKLGEKQAEAVNAHLLRMGVAARAVQHPSLTHRVVVEPLPRKTHPRISIVIPTKDAPALISRCLDSIYLKTEYPNFEVVVVDNETTDPAALAALDRHPITRVPLTGKFNYSRANNVGVAAARGSVLVLLNNDTEIIHGDWLKQLLFLLEEPGVAAVSPMLLYPDNTVQHAGVALGIRGTADHVLRGHSPESDGYFGSLACTREVSAVTFACVMMRRGDYEAVGGMQELYGTHYQDVDFCLRLRARGDRILFTPHTSLIHHESATRGSSYDMLDRALLLDAWQDRILDGDPYSRWEPHARADGRVA